MKMLSVTALSVVALVATQAVPAAADNHMEEMQFGPVELMACSFKEDKDWSDFKDVMKKFNRWLDRNDKDYSYWTITPRYREDNELDFAWIGGWSSGAAMGASWDAWVEDSGDAGEAFDEAVECNSTLAAVTDIHVPNDDWMSRERGVLWFARCSTAEGKNLGDAVAAHATTDAAMTEMGSPTLSWAFVPALGAGGVEFDYYHVASWASYADLGAGFDSYFNGGGWKVAAEAEGGVTQCESPNVYDFRLQRQGDR